MVERPRGHAWCEEHLNKDGKVIITEQHPHGAPDCSGKHGTEAAALCYSWVFAAVAPQFGLLSMGSVRAVLVARNLRRLAKN